MNDLRQALGRWSNAPLALVVAQVRFEPHPQFDPQQVAGRIQQATGERYPRLNPLQQFSVILGLGQLGVMPPPVVQVGFDLRNDVDNEVVRMQPDALTFMTSAYQDSTHFSDLWRVFMAVLCEDRALTVTRLGLRYVDFIIPSPGHVPEDYFLDGLGRSPACLGEQSPVAFTLYDFPRADGGQLRLQYGRGFGPPSLPPDLQDSVLPPSSLTTRNSGDLSAVLDMDRWRLVNEFLSPDAIAREIEVLRTDMSASFRGIMTPLADTEWRLSSNQGES